MDTAFNKVYYGILLIFLSGIANHSFGQTISGEIRDTAGHLILSATVLLKDSVRATLIKEFTLAANGKYTLVVKKTYRQLSVEVNAPGYLAGYVVVDSIEPGKNYLHNFYLVRDTVPVALEEVIVTAKKKPFQIKGDTVTYNVAAYSNGTERKIQDLIRKLPGIEVNEKTGEIKYKGKTVETVKLDGEDLFGSSYSIGTKNINTGMIAQVQAIDNYSPNPLLKGIEDGDKVALNLVVKNKKTDYSGNTDLGTGLLGQKAAFDASANLLGIGAIHKSFATASYNNIGINNSPFDYFTYTPKAEQLNDASLLAKKYIPDTYIDNGAAPERSNTAATLFGSYNALWKAGKKITLKNNLYYQKVSIQSGQFYSTVNNINGIQFNTSDLYTTTKKPTLYRGDAEATWKISPTSLLVYTLTCKIENSHTISKVLQNDSNHYATDLATQDIYSKQIITYTKKINSRNAIRLIATQAVNDVPQDYLLMPAIVTPSVNTSNNQHSRFKNTCTIIESNLLGSREKSKYTLAVGANYQKTLYHSMLTGNSDNMSIGGFTNTNKYVQTKAFMNAFYQFQFDRIKIKPSISFSYLQQSLKDSMTTDARKKADFLPEPALSLTCKLSNFSGILMNATIRRQPFSAEYFAANPVFVSTRVVQSNQVSLHIQNAKQLSLFYIINNLYKQLQLQAGSIYAVNRGNYFPNITVKQNTTRLEYFYLPESNQLLSFNGSIEKYVPLLQATIRLSGNYTSQWYKNIVNNSSLRNNTAQTLSTEFYIRTAFDATINIENAITVNRLVSKSGEGETFQQSSLTDKYKLVAKPLKRLYVVLQTEYVLPDISAKGQHYIFLDADASYQTKNKRCDFRFRAGNISNNRSLGVYSVSDYATAVSQTNILSRYFVWSISFNF